jgi:hypothetical protein
LCAYSYTKVYTLVKWLKVTFWGQVVEDVRTVFEERNDVTIFIPEVTSV